MTEVAIPIPQFRHAIPLHKFLYRWRRIPRPAVSKTIAARTKSVLGLR